MILVLYNNKMINKDFIDYLLSIEKEVTVLSFLQVKECIIKDSIQGSTVWCYKTKTIDFNNLTGIYNEISYLSLEDFKDYISSDREYVCAEWTAYLMFVMQKYHVKVFNPFNHYILSGDIFNLPFIYKMCSTKGLATPKITLSMDKVELERLLQSGSYIPLSNLAEKFSFQKHDILSADSVGLIEYCTGTPIIVHVLNDTVFACEVIEDKKSQYALPLEIKEICIQITLELGFKLAEFIFKKDKESNLILYRFSHMPRFINNLPQNLQIMYTCLYQKLLNKFT